MPDRVLLRFRNLTANVNTVDEHNALAAAQGRVLWGWWKKPFESTPDPGLTILAQDLVPDRDPVYFIDSGTRKLYRAPLVRIHYEPGGAPRPAPNPALCPAYYREMILPAWFEIRAIEEHPDGLSYLRSFVWSRSNRT